MGGGLLSGGQKWGGSASGGRRPPISYTPPPQMFSTASLRIRLENEIGEELFREMFSNNLQYLMGIWSGTVESFRHTAYHKSVPTRVALFYQMITDPFTELQVDWLLEEIQKIWMKNDQGARDNISG